MAAVLFLLLIVAIIVTAVALIAAPSNPLEDPPIKPNRQSAARDARVVRDYAVLEEHYRNFIDELYDVGEDAVQQQRDES